MKILAREMGYGEGMMVRRGLERMSHGEYLREMSKSTSSVVHELVSQTRFHSHSFPFLIHEFVTRCASVIAHSFNTIMPACGRDVHRADEKL